jgi:hypothetical protein
MHICLLKSCAFYLRTLTNPMLPSLENVQLAMQHSVVTFPHCYTVNTVAATSNWLLSTCSQMQITVSDLD